MTLTEFLLARIAADAAAARAILDLFYGEGCWKWDLHLPRPVKVALVDERGVRMVETVGDGPTWMVADHIARHDPARVLAECESKRRIVAEFEGEVKRGPAGERSDFVARHGGILDAYGWTLRLLALPYADHPDYRPEWRP